LKKVENNKEKDMKMYKRKEKRILKIMRIKEKRKNKE